MGDSNFSLIPVVRPSHCPYARISNADSPRQVILYTKTNSYTLINRYSIGDGYNHQTQAFTVALPLCVDSKLRSLTSAECNVVKRLSPQSALQTASLTSGFHQCLPPPQQAATRRNPQSDVAKIRRIWEKTKKKTEKVWMC